MQIVNSVSARTREGLNTVNQGRATTAAVAAYERENNLFVIVRTRGHPTGHARTICRAQRVPSHCTASHVPVSIYGICLLHNRTSTVIITLNALCWCLRVCAAKSSVLGSDRPVDWMGQASLVCTCYVCQKRDVFLARVSHISRSAVMLLLLHMCRASAVR